MLPFFTELARVLATVSEEHFKKTIKAVKENSRQVYFIGNGGSAAIASHMAIDWANKGGFNTRDLNNPAALTCLANDYGYENVFAKQLNGLRGGDLLVAISSSGESRNILRAVDRVRKTRALVMTLSGFSPNNALRKCDGLQFYIPSDNYAIVENAHMAILHAMLEELKG